MPKVKDAKTGKTYTTHWQTSPKNYLKEACAELPRKPDPQQAAYSIDALKNRFSGKVRKASSGSRAWSTSSGARGLGVDEAVLEQVRGKHYEAHVHWEWWTRPTVLLPQPRRGH